MELFDPQGRRLYLTNEECQNFLQAANDADRHVKTFCLVLAFTGCRISEALALRPKSFNFSGKAIVFETLKKRRRGVYRAVPMPGEVCWTPSTWATASGKPRNAKKAQNRKAPYGTGRA